MKYANKTPFMRFLHKNTGFIICGVFLAVLIPFYFYETNSQEFFETWTCPQIKTYMLIYDQDVYKYNYPDFEHLTESQKTKFDGIVQECNFGELIK